jgi:hypothetical protein
MRDAALHRPTHTRRRLWESSSGLDHNRVYYMALVTTLLTYDVKESSPRSHVQRHAPLCQRGYAIISKSGAGVLTARGWMGSSFVGATKNQGNSGTWLDSGCKSALYMGRPALFSEWERFTLIHQARKCTKTFQWNFCWPGECSCWYFATEIKGNLVILIIYFIPEFHS